MPSVLNPYLSFRDTARQAMQFYQAVFGGELTLSTFGEMHAGEDPIDSELGCDGLGYRLGIAGDHDDGDTEPA